MTSLDIGLLGLCATLTLVIFGAPVGAVLGLVAFAGLALVLGLGPALSMSVSLPFEFIADWSISAIPMFILMGYIAAESGIAASVFKLMRMALVRLPGGLACASVGACAIFASASGSSLATAAAMGRVCIPEMRAAGYKDSLATGCIASAGTLGSLIPPSILLIIYAYFANVSVSAVFLAAVIPGVASAALYASMIISRATISPDLAPRSTESFSRDEVIETVKRVFYFPLLVTVVLGGIFMGIVTPTEGGAVGAAAATLIAVLVYDMSLKQLWTTCLESVRSSCTIFFIAIGAVIYARFVSITGIPGFITDALSSDSPSVWLFIIQVSIIMIILGMFIDAISLLLIMLPVFVPLASAVGVDLIWFGIVVIKLCEIGLVTPPVGMNVYVISGVAGKDVQITSIFKGAAWFILMDVLVILLLLAFPAAMTLQ
ncbi:TRAP transporter large permease subunit [Roseovarius aestuarii]|nr:TRAP transporter large permease subunit [Roseovarius aestuarii]